MLPLWLPDHNVKNERIICWCVEVKAAAIANAVEFYDMVGTALGGINVGGGKGTSVTTTTYSQRVVSVSPKSIVLLEDVSMFTLGSEKALRVWLCYKKVGIEKQKWTACLPYIFNDL